MRICRMRTCHMENPLGVLFQPLTVSWTVEGSASAGQQAARICIYEDGAAEPVYDSGIRQELDSLGTHIPLTLRPRTRYRWTVTVWGDAGDWCVSEPAWFETGKAGEPWTGKWITPDEDCLPILEKELELPEGIRSARVYASGLGLYRLFVNGVPASDELLPPGLNGYDTWVQAQTYDVGPLLHAGKNTLSIWLGNGIARGRFSYIPEDGAAYCALYTAIAELHLRLTDGQELCFGTDGSWRWRPSPIVETSVYNGEVWDAGRTGALRPVRCCTPPVGALCDRLSPPVRVVAQVAPIALLTTPKGERVLDMGQNMVGRMRFRVRAPKGMRLTLQHGEILQDGCFYRENLRTAKAAFTYISDGTGATAEAMFTWFGFRYVLLEGFPEEIRLSDFTGLFLSSDLEPTGSLLTSDPLLNRLLENADRSRRGNFLDVPTDCPQRDEREGWTGDAQIFCETAMYECDAYAFYTKYLHDMWQEQQQHGGCVPHVVPNARKRVRTFEGGAVGWADAATVIPWTMYRIYGDAAILHRQYDSMKAWTDWAAAQEDWSLAVRHFGDWLSLDHPDRPEQREGGTDLGLLCGVYLCLSATLTGKAAGVLGKAEEQQHYMALAAQIRSRMRERYFDAEGHLLIPTQTAGVTALTAGFAPDPALTQRELAERLARDGSLTTGFLGTPWLLNCLPPKLAWDLLLRKEYPSWLYAVELGATSIWERWDSVLPDGRLSGSGMNSLNHYAYGSVTAWIYRSVCGLQPDEAAPGFRKLHFAPQPDSRVDWIRCRFRAAVGEIRCGWEKTEDGFRIELELPFGCEAEVALPDGFCERATAGLHIYTLHAEREKIGD